MFATYVHNKDPQESVSILHKTLDAGINVVDTTEAYSESELAGLPMPRQAMAFAITRPGVSCALH
ncbi:MAG: hypothetical protein ACYC1E_09570 [Propionibacteriaceae bacterium]